MAGNTSPHRGLAVPWRLLLCFAPPLSPASSPCLDLPRHPSAPLHALHVLFLPRAPVFNLPGSGRGHRLPTVVAPPSLAPPASVQCPLLVEVSSFQCLRSPVSINTPPSCCVLSPPTHGSAQCGVPSRQPLHPPFRGTSLVPSSSLFLGLPLDPPAPCRSRNIRCPFALARVNHTRSPPPPPVPQPGPRPSPPHSFRHTTRLQWFVYLQPRYVCLFFFTPR